MGIYSERAAAKKLANQKWAELYEDAGAVADLFEHAGEPLPDGLAKLLGIGEDEAKDVPMKTVPAPYDRPSHIPPHWISVPVTSAMPITLVQAVLYGEHEPQRVKEVIARVRALMPERMIEEAQVYTIGTRLKTHDKLDYVTGLSWILRNPDDGLRVINGRVWGPREAFTLAEVAILRREALVEVLKVTGALTRPQILSVLKNTPWAEFSQPLLSKDLETLEQKRIVKKNRLNQKWELVAQPQVEAQQPLARVHRIGASVRGIRVRAD